MDDDSIQKQIEVKKKRLEELKQKRLQRQQKQDDGSASSSTATTAPSISTSALPQAPYSSSPSSSPRPALSSSQSLQQLPASTDDLLDVVNSLITTAQPPPPAQPAAQPALQPAAVPPPKPKLAVAPQPSVSVAPIDTIVYEIATQTNESYLVLLESDKEKEREKEKDKGADSRQPHSPTKAKKVVRGRISTTADDDEAEEIRAERDTLRQRETELMTTIKQLKSQVEQLTQQQQAPATATALSAVESEEVLKRSEFVSFFTRSSLLMERALEVQERAGYYDFTVDYALEDEGEAGKGAVETLVPRLWFDDVSKTGGRPVSALDWSPKHPELLLAAYASTDEDDASTASYLSPSSSAQQQGCVLVWNVHLTSRPEYTFTCDSSILCAFFHPTQPKLLLGASASGQLLLWDARAKAAPVNRTGMGSGHSFPVYGMKMHANQLVSVSSDGYVCHWQEENWHVPSNAYVLKGSGVGGELSVSCMDIAGGVMYVGGDDGCVYKAKMHADREGEHVFDTVRAHDAPISSLSFQPSTATTGSATSNASALYLTSSYDWSVKLWSQHTPTPLASFESSRDYTYDAAWHPTHPGLFVSGDSTGQLDVWRLGAKGGGGDKVDGGAGVGGVGGAGGGGVGAGEEGGSVSLQAKGWEVPQFTTHVTDGAVTQPRTSTDSNSGEGVAPTTAAAGGLGGVAGRTHALSKLRWHGDGSMLSVGTSAGGVSVYELNREVMECSRDEAERWWQYIERRR